MTVATRRGAVRTRARVTARVDRGALFMSFHFAEAPANRLTNDARDPAARIPEFKACAADHRAGGLRWSSARTSSSSAPPPATWARPSSPAR